jgi:dTDP-L-rhamnose 4-epimerase
MGEQILITGGAGFIGSHLADELLAQGYRVRALDSLTPDVHGPAQQRPPYLADEVELMVGDVRDSEVVERALERVDAVFHLAAIAGAAHSMRAAAEYTAVNNLGTSVLLEAVVRRPIRRLVVGSSMALYGEGLYRDPRGRLVSNATRSRRALAAGQWEPQTITGLPLVPIPTPELKRPFPGSDYALSKFDQERMCLALGAAYSIPTVALRFFNVYGPRQAPENPYSGALATFAARLLAGQPPLISEDGYQQRDFVSVYDVARACRLALEASAIDGHVLNVGSGEGTTMRDVAAELAAALGVGHISAEATESHSPGEIRHCFADITEARSLLGYEPGVALGQGLADLAEWVAGQTSATRARAVGERPAAGAIAV